MYTNQDDVEVYFDEVADAERFVDTVDELSDRNVYTDIDSTDLSSSDLDECAAEAYAKKQGYIVLDTRHDEQSGADQGYDVLAYDPKTNEVVGIESKMRGHDGPIDGEIEEYPSPERGWDHTPALGRPNKKGNMQLDPEWRKYEHRTMLGFAVDNDLLDYDVEQSVPDLEDEILTDLDESKKDEMLTDLDEDKKAELLSDLDGSEVNEPPTDPDENEKDERLTDLDESKKDELLTKNKKEILPELDEEEVLPAVHGLYEEQIGNTEEMGFRGEAVYVQTGDPGDPPIKNFDDTPVERAAVFGVGEDEIKNALDRDDPELEQDTGEYSFGTDEPEFGSEFGDGELHWSGGVELTDDEERRWDDMKRRAGAAGADELTEQKKIDAIDRELAATPEQDLDDDTLRDMASATDVASDEPLSREDYEQLGDEDKKADENIQQKADKLDPTFDEMEKSAESDPDADHEVPEGKPQAAKETEEDETVGDEEEYDVFERLRDDEIKTTEERTEKLDNTESDHDIIEELLSDDDKEEREADESETEDQGRGLL